jgi:hypothetical protein
MSDSPAVVLMTAGEGPDGRALEAGAAAYLRKDGDLGPLVDIVVAFASLDASSP